MNSDGGSAEHELAEYVEPATVSVKWHRPPTLKFGVRCAENEDEQNFENGCSEPDHDRYRDTFWHWHDPASHFSTRDDSSSCPNCIILPRIFGTLQNTFGRPDIEGISLRHIRNNPFDHFAHHTCHVRTASDTNLIRKSTANMNFQRTPYLTRFQTIEHSRRR